MDLAAIIDGEDFGGGALDNILIRVSYDEHDELIAEVEPEYKRACKDLDMNQYLRQCLEFVKKYENEVVGACPDCDGEVIYMNR